MNMNFNFNNPTNLIFAGQDLCQIKTKKYQLGINN